MNNIICDLNNLFFRSLFITSGYGKKNMTFDSKDELAQLMRKVAMDISYIIRQTNSTRVVLAMDSSSWRKDIEIEENEGYKGHREKSAKINWENVFNIMDEFSEILEDKGFIRSKIHKAEGDDLVTLWRDLFLYDYQQNVIIVSGDKDLRQLVKSYEGNEKAFSVVYNPFKHGKASKKLYVPKGFGEWLSDSEKEGDIFDRGINIDKEDFNNLLNSEDISVEKVDGDYVALHKIFCGDDGDNIPAIYTWLNKNGNTTRITNSKFEKILQKIPMSSYLDVFENESSIQKAITEIAKSEPPFDIHSRLERQAKLVALDSNLFPKEIVNMFNEEVEERIKDKKVNPQTMHLQTLLEGTEYVSENPKKNNSSESSIFGDLDNINKELF